MGKKQRSETKKQKVEKDESETEYQEEEDAFDEGDVNFDADNSDSDAESDQSSSMASKDSFDEEEDEEDMMDLDEDEVENEKRPKKNSSEAFATAINKILASNLKGNDKKQPILARSKGTERRIADEKLEYKARKVLAAEKKANRERGRIIPDFTTYEYEKRLRKVATRGVVKLFNAVRAQQKMTEVAVKQASEKHKTTTAIDKAKKVSTMSKANFLDLLKSGSK
ncbi:hypothetical protein VTP01DRAFT_6584 [Rhizomucor pusillus]|uniref:uncharacterized protein n=1 Tax=Rhizomucor pusillus TaxID=4840 RepID=UPI003742A9F4